ncbi:MAG: NADH-quinone oxidoreductase subunit NuoH [Chloroflexi bacterium]|nr:NADH-quinone oxidoreductase subunit NuoH [Chloroflexota bacterium]MQC27997.1 NADH-quinone oxidoreductase subunit NuoH [Chloroflexota bacterium]
MNTGLFGIDNVNVWVDAVIRLNIIVILMTIVVMGLIYGERKIIARFQQRLGPTRTGPFGLLQSVADALKLVAKEDLRPKGADPWVFELAVYFVFVPVFLGFVAIPFAFNWNVRVLELGLFYIIAVSSVNIVGWVMAGWASDNRYAMIGALRAAAQGISYELPLILSLIAVSMIVSTDAGRGSLDLNTIVAEQGRVPYIVWQPLAFVIFYAAMLAELNRSPFDIPVGESEVVGGPFVEYSGIRWSMFFLAEYAGLFILALLGSAVFLGGWAWPLGEEAGAWLQIPLTAGKALFLIFTVFWVRVTVPRMRIDQLMGFSWKVLLPISFGLILGNGLVLVYGWADVFLLVPNVIGLVVLYVAVDQGITRRRTRPLARPVAPAAAGAEGTA